MTSIGLLAETQNVEDGLRSITHLCNVYVNNQVPDNAQAIEAAVRGFVDRNLTNPDDQVKLIVNQLNEALHKNRDGVTNAEGDLVNEIRAIVDVIEAKNLTLNFDASS